MSARPDTSSAATLAALGAGTMIATHTAGRATRDGMFLSNFDISSLPLMFIAAAMLSLVTLLWASRTMARMSPGRLIPVAFAGSGLLLIAEWGLWFRSQPLTAVVLYLHLAALGAFLISGFWSVVNERFDPRTARKKVSLIAGGGTVGGLVGGITAERIAALGSVATMLPLMAAMHLACAVLVTRLCAQTPASQRSRKQRPSTGTFAGVSAVARDTYLRNIAALVLLTGATATLLDYVFKARVFAVYDQGPELTRFFAIFYTAIALVTFLVQTLLGRRALEKLGLAGTAATLPLVTTIGSCAALFMPGLAPIGVLKGSEASIRSSLFRSGYELLYTPVALGEKRSAKSIIDVGVDRVADGLAASAIFLLLLLPSTLSLPALVALALALGIGALDVTRRLQKGYVGALKDRLIDGSDDQGTMTPGGGADSMVMQTIGNLDLRAVLGQTRTVSENAARSDHAGTTVPQDLVVAAMADLRSGNAERVRRRLKHNLDTVLAPQVIALLAWDSVSDHAVRALRGMGPGIVGQLTDALLDPNAEFAVRRRIPRIMATCDSSRSVEGLLKGLEDSRFEVRFQSASALSRIHALQPDITIPSEHIKRIVRKELGVGMRGWTSRRLMDSNDLQSDDDAFFQDDDSLLDDRLNLSLIHVFRLLSLVFEKVPVRVALRGLHTDDAHLRGTALEYLEHQLPDDIFSRLSKFLPEDRPLPQPSERQKQRDLRSELMLSRQSIEINLENLKKKAPKESE